MQTWAKRGVQAALVTGGMLAVGTGVASADQACPDRSAPESGDPAAGRHPRHGQTCFSGELFPGEIGQSRAKHATALSGSLDPVRDLLPAVENETTREIPVVRDRSWHAAQQPQRLHLAGWSADPAQAEVYEPESKRPGGAHRLVVTPSDGFHRSLSWTGPIGNVVADDAEPAAAPEPTAAPEQRSGLVTALEDLVFFDGFPAEDATTQATPAGAAGGLLNAATDLTSANVPTLNNRLHLIPQELLTRTLSTTASQSSARSESVSLELPGEHQAQVNEVPDPHLPVEDRSSGPGMALDGKPGATADTSAGPSPSPIMAALDGSRSDQEVFRQSWQAQAGPRFAREPLRSDVEVTLLDELLAGLPEKQWITRNPFPLMTLPQVPDLPMMALPVLDGIAGLAQPLGLAQPPGAGQPPGPDQAPGADQAAGWDRAPGMSAVSDETMPLPRLDPETLGNADTVVLDRI